MNWTNYDTEMLAECLEFRDIPLLREVVRALGEKRDLEQTADEHISEVIKTLRLIVLGETVDLEVDCNEVFGDGFAKPLGVDFDKVDWRQIAVHLAERVNKENP